MVIGMAIAAKNRNGIHFGVGQIYTNDFIAGFSLTGHILGIIIVLIGIYIAFTERWSNLVIAMVRGAVETATTPALTSFCGSGSFLRSFRFGSSAAV